MPERYLGVTLGGRYTLARLLGAGAYAWVYEARDTELDIPVAVKVLRPEHTGDGVVETRVRREATTAARLRHPHIITIRDVGHADGLTWVVMDLVPGALALRLQRQSVLPEAEVVRLGLEIAAALGVAHAAGIIHRDIKVDNILLGSAGEAIVCDFGLARALTGGTDLSATNQVVGTPHYFSPEQARGAPLDGRSDLYALGVTLYRAATGRLPFDGDDWYTVARKHVDEPPPDPRSVRPELSPAFAEILLRLLAKRPDDRYRDAMALAHAFAELPTAPPPVVRIPLGTGGTTAVHPIIARTLPWWRRPLTLLATALSIVAVVVWSSRSAPNGSTIWARLRGVRPAPDSTPILRDGAPLRMVDPRLTPAASADSAAVSTMGGAPPVARTGTLRITAPPGSELRVNGTLVDGPRWFNPQASPGAFVVQARFADGQGLTACPFSQRTDTLRLRPGERVEYTVPLARCAEVSLDVTPREAQVTFTDSLGDIIHLETAVDSAVLVLRAATWRIEGRAPRCATYSADHLLQPGTNVIRFVLLC